MSPTMTARRILAILFVFAATTFAWFTLGASLVHRSEASSAAIHPALARLWGGEHVQQAPTAVLVARELSTEEVVEKDDAGREVTRETRRESKVELPVSLAASLVTVDLDLEHRRKGLLWYDVYTVDFAGHYRLRVPGEGEQEIRVRFAFPTADAMYDGFELTVGDRRAAPVTNLSDGLSVTVVAAGGAELPIAVRYRSRGLDRWSYAFQPSGVAQVRDFRLAMSTDFEAIDFPDGGLSPTTRSRAGEGWRLIWEFDSLVTGKQVVVDLPNRLNPGPLAARITFFAPVSLLFFVTILLILGILRRRNLHPMHYFFLAAAFFAFHLLLAYLVDHLDIHLAFLIAAAVSLFLVVSYLRIVGGERFAFRQAGLAQLVYLVLFNYAFFFEGYTGLTITVGSVVTLFVLMQVTAPVDWNRAMGPPAESLPETAG